MATYTAKHGTIFEGLTLVKYDASGNVTYYPGDIVADSKSKGIDYHMIAARFQVAF